MEANRLKQLQRLRGSIPDMQKTLDTVKFLESKQVSSVGFRGLLTIEFREGDGDAI